MGLFGDGTQRINLADGFDEFWEHYPKRNGKKIGKKQARDVWASKRLSDKATQILAAIKRQVAYRDRVVADGEFHPEFPDAHRWLRHSRWEDEVPDEKPLQSRGPTRESLMPHVGHMLAWAKNNNARLSTPEAFQIARESGLPWDWSPSDDEIRSLVSDRLGIRVIDKNVEQRPAPQDDSQDYRMERDELKRNLSELKRRLNRGVH